MKKIFTIILAVFCLMLSAKATPITQEQASIVCHNFLIQKSLNGDVASTEFQYHKTEMKDGVAVAYIFRCDPVGFVVIAASDRFEPVLCYSFESDYLHNPAFDFAMEAYANLVAYFEHNGKEFRPGVTEKWQRYLDNDFTAEPQRGVVVGPLLTTKWDQGMYFNTYCPWDAAAGMYNDYRVVTGCVATAMSQVMNYHGHPYRGKLGSSYIAGPYGRYTVMFNNQTYNYNAMPNIPHDYSNEMAKLIHHCGVAVQMGYTPTGSGAHSVSAADALKRHFKYDSAWICSRQLFDSIGDWYNALKTDLNARRPLYYSADNGQDGHAFVVDGYDEDNKFHVNWGWGGSADGYFTISDNNISDMQSFIYHAEAIRLAFPCTDAPGVSTGFHRLDAATGTFYSGMPTINYAPNNTCQWMLAAPEASKYVLHFDRFSTEAGNDVLTVYNGPTEQSGIAGTYSGSTIPGNLTVVADSVLVVFTTDGQNEDRGFQISYTATTAAPYCSDATISNTGTTFISDGSEDQPYRNNTVCNWNINVSNMSRCYFSFPQLEFGSGDFIEIYNKTTTPGTLLYRFDKDNYPASDVITCDYGKLSVRFVADNWDVGNGFTVTVEPVTSVNDYAGIEDLRIFPNPATDQISVNFESTKNETFRCQIIDMTGKVIESRTYQHAGGMFEDTFNISNLAKGMYFIRIESEEGATMEKFVRQ
ncbi:MAG: C10 family peptidase [Bacteroidales bacterium]|nr:C10 family peptidase [Bacteroidales bacterium]